MSVTAAEAARVHNRVAPVTAAEVLGIHNRTAPVSIITAIEWLDIRDDLARAIKQGATPSTQFTTCVNIAEHLLRQGVIDTNAISARRRADAQEVEDAIASLREDAK